VRAYAEVREAFFLQAQRAMKETAEAARKPVVEIAEWELNTITLELLLLSAIVTGALTGLGPRMIAPSVPRYIWATLGFGLLGLLLVPVQSIVSRTRTGGTFSVRRAIEGVLIGTVVYGIVMRLLW
jgi:hypothetical protein